MVSSPKQSSPCIYTHIKANVHYDSCFLLPTSSTTFSKELKMTVSLIYLFGGVMWTSANLVYYRNVL
jgi:hypothetical protein